MNIFLKIGAAAVVASYIAPTIANKFVRPEQTTMDSIVNDGIIAASAGVSAAAVFWALSQVIGGPKASVAGGGGAS